MKEPMRVVLREVVAYEVSTPSGKPLGQFVKRSEWNRMVDLVNAEGDVLIINDLGIIASLLPGRQIHDVDVIAASPGLVDRVNEKAAE